MPLHIQNIRKSYNGIPVLQDLTLDLEDGGIYCLMAPSGAGKTTLLRILMGLETADSGRIYYEDAAGREIPAPAAAAVFQEDRLCPGLSAGKNIQLVHPGCTEEELRRELLALLPADSLKKPVSEFSGGMRRRVSLLRAMLSDGQLLLMDEPFNGLDAETKEQAIQYVLSRRRGRTLLFTTHLEEECEALQAVRLSLMPH